jgi:tRNA(Ile)-lysidine synthase
MPTRNLLSEIERGLVYSQDDANPLIEFSGFQFRKYQGVLYLLRAKQSQADSHSNSSVTSWQPSSNPVATIGGLQLRIIKLEGEGVKASLIDKEFTLRFRQGGERFHPSNRNHSQSLKKLLQEAGVPPWERDAIPLLYHGEELVAVIGYWVAKACRAGPDETGWGIEVITG